MWLRLRRYIVCVPFLTQISAKNIRFIGIVRNPRSTQNNTKMLSNMHANFNITILHGLPMKDRLNAVNVIA